jgi:mRNA interferase RelE/StbE
MPRNLSERIRHKIDLLAEEPFGENNNVIKMKGVAGCRLRVGDWRVVYVVDEEVLEILIVKVAPRGEVYKL